MKWVQATRQTYDANTGRIMPGEKYWVEDDKAERWINAGIATTTEAPPPQPPAPDPVPIPPEPPPEPEPEEEGEESPEDDNEELRAEARKLSEGGDSQRMIAEKLGISRQRVHRLLTTG
jgi:hypothetical protein